MNQPTEPISSHDPPGGPDGSRFDRPQRRRLVPATVRTVHVVMVGVLGQHQHQLPTAEDQHPIQQLTPNRAHPPLRVGVRLWRPHRRAKHPDPLSGEDRDERGGEPGVAIVDQEPEQADAVLQAMSRLRACWVTHAPTGCAVTASTWTRRLAISSTNRTYSCCRKTVSTVKKSTASTPLAWTRRNCRQERADRAGAGSTPAQRRMLHTVLAPILSL